MSQPNDYMKCIEFTRPGSPRIVRPRRVLQIAALAFAVGCGSQEADEKADAVSTQTSLEVPGTNFCYYDSVNYLGYYHCVTLGTSDDSTYTDFVGSSKECTTNIFGNYDCDNWRWSDAAKSTFNAGSMQLDSSLDDHVSAWDDSNHCMTLRGSRPGLSDFGDIWKGYKRITCPTANTQWNEILEWWGSSANGGGMAIGSLNGNSSPDLVLLHIDHTSSNGGGNNAYYRVLWDVQYQNGDYRHTSSTGPIAIGNWWGSSNQGAGAALYDIDGNGVQDLVVVHIDHPGTGNKVYYRIGWNLNSSTGQATSWTGPIATSVWSGSSSAGADVAVTDLDGNGRPELIIGQVDDPSTDNYLYWNVIWNVSTSGVASGASSTFKMPYSVGSYTSDMGLYVADMNGDGNKDLVASWIDDPNAPNTIYYRVGYSLTSSGAVTTWGPAKKLKTYAAGTDGGHGMVAWDFNSDGKKDLAYFWLDNGGTEGLGYWDTSLSEGDGLYKIVNKGDTMCMDVYFNSTASGTRVNQYACNGSSAQGWTVVKDLNGNYALIGQSSLKCLDVLNASTSTGAGLQIWDCNDTNAQRYTLTADGSGYYTIKNINSGLCVEVPNSSTKSELQLVQNTCTSADNQKWQLSAL